VGSATFGAAARGVEARHGGRRGGERRRGAERGSAPREPSHGAVSRLEVSPVWLRSPGPFALGEVAADHFPFRSWSRLVARHARDPGPELVRYGLALGHPPFREALARYLRAARGLRCESDQVMVVSGSQQAIELSARVLLDPGSAVWLEEPGYWGARKALVAAGARVVPVPVDGAGLDVEAGIARAPQARAVFVTPSHQMPMGVMMSAARRLRLLEWARTSGAWIVEDDYNSEYRYESQPIAALQALDRDARVVYIGTLSKVLLPSLRIGYLVLPPDLVERFRVLRNAVDISPPTLVQAALADLIEEGHFARHLRRTRELYREKRDRLMTALERELGDRLRVHGARAGLHLTVTLETDRSDRAVALAAAQREIWTPPLSEFYQEEPRRQGLVLGYGGIALDRIAPAVRKLRQIHDAVVESRA
jgi:GntR family transcriptional regulator/MocR family aminotransferase